MSKHRNDYLAWHSGSRRHVILAPEARMFTACCCKNFTLRETLGGE
jgi:hypothetical protein